MSIGDTNSSLGEEPQPKLPFAEKPEVWALWRLSLILQEIAADSSGQRDDRERAQGNQEEKE